MKHVLASIIALMYSMVPSIGEACTICFYGDSNTPENRGLRMGILVLLAFLVIIMLAFVKFIINFKKRSKLL